MKKFYPALFIICAFASSSCGWFKEKAKETTNKAGEVVAKSGSEFVDGVAKGVEASFANEVVISPALIDSGISAGKITVKSNNSGTDNILEAYLIFEKPFSGNISTKVFDREGKEYGRTKAQVSASAGEARYIDFVFDKRTNIDGRGKIVFE